MIGYSVLTVISFDIDSLGGIIGDGVEDGDGKDVCVGIALPETIPSPHGPQWSSFE